MRLVPIAALALLATAALPAHAESLPPRDECASLPGFAAFRARLDDAVFRRDVEALLALTDPNIALDFGGGAGHAQMREDWRLGEGSQSPIWGELGTMLRLGCAGNADGAAMPHMFNRFPERYDPFASALTIGIRIALRAGPSFDARVLARLDFETLALTGTDPEAEWQPVRMDDGRAGFVHRDLLRRPIDYRLIFDRVNGQWRIGALIAGD
ncbi:MAG: SH3 domain-containing protein [Sphingomonadaceae bacterium]|nr:SH3 domain-containing protein [Sphingomonadaceae bacterium]